MLTFKTKFLYSIVFKLASNNTLSHRYLFLKEVAVIMKIFTYLDTV
jgi:hypothetical protein